MWRLMVALGMVVMLGVLPARGQDDDVIETTFFLTFIPNVQFAPVYVALEKGYFADAGFDVTIEHGDEPLGVTLIAAGERQFGIISGEQVIGARANDLPVVYFYEWFQTFPVGVAVTHDSGIETVDDLRGRRVGIPGRFGASYSGLVALLAAYNMTEQDIDLQEIGFNAPEVICVGGVEASVIYLNNEPLQVEQRAAAGDCGDVTGVDVFRVADAADMVSNGLVTSEAMIADHPEQVAAFAAAFDRGLRDTINNPAEAYLISARYVENLVADEATRAALEAAAEEERAFLSANDGADREQMAGRRQALYESLAADLNPADLLQFRVLLESIALWDADRLGYSDPSSWDTTQTTLISMSFLEQPIDLESAYTNDFLPGEDEG